VNLQLISDDERCHGYTYVLINENLLSLFLSLIVEEKKLLKTILIDAVFAEVLI
jgi:hypothetical protein